MKSRRIFMLFSIVAFAGLVQVAQAGIIRYAGKEIGKGASNASQVAAAGGAAVVDGTAAAGHATVNAATSGLNAAEGGVAAAAGSLAAAGAATGGAVEDHTSGVTRTLKSASDAVGDGARSVAGKIWRIVW
jgi:hypothetical protein